MKLIIAYIQPERLKAVKQELHEKEVYRMSVSNALGCGRQKGHLENCRETDVEVNLLEKTRLEIAVNDDALDRTIDAIIAAARTGNIGDGKIFILDLVDCIRVRTGERGDDAIG